MQVVGGLVLEVFNQVALVLLLTVYIMATRGEGGFGKGGGSVSRDLNLMIEHYIKLKTALSLCTGVVVAVILLACQVRSLPRSHNASVVPAQSAGVFLT